MSLLEILETQLVGNFYFSFRTGDSWGFQFDKFWIVSYEMESEDESELNSKIVELYPPANDTVDKGDIAKSIVAAANTRNIIAEVKLREDSSLELVFENGNRFFFPTNTEIVDWHWCLNRTGYDPYNGYDIACFAPGDVRVHKN